MVSRKFLNAIKSKVSVWKKHEVLGPKKKVPLTSYDLHHQMTELQSLAKKIKTTKAACQDKIKAIKQVEEEVIQAQRAMITSKKKLASMQGQSLPPNEVDNMQFKPLRISEVYSNM